jgi:hypothetical protein
MKFSFKGNTGVLGGSVFKPKPPPLEETSSMKTDSVSELEKSLELTVLKKSLN